MLQDRAMASVLSWGTPCFVEETRMELPPGFRFHPTDEELIVYYLHTGQATLTNYYSCATIADVDIYKFDPWDLPCKAVFGQQEWYFSSIKDRKYPTGMRTNRATASGYWKANGKDKQIGHRALVGKKKTLASYTGRAPIEHQTGVDVSTNSMRLDDLDGRLGHGDQDEPDEFRYGRFTILMFPDHRIGQLLLEFWKNHWDYAHDDHSLNMAATPKEEDSVRCSVRAPKPLLSVHHHPLIKMWQSASKWSSDILTSCARLITPKRTCGGIFTAKPKYETPNAGAGPVSEYIIRKLFERRNRLTVNESEQHSDPYSRRAENTEMAVCTRTLASWIVATAAPHHATGDRNLLSGFTMEHDDLFVHAVNRVPMKVLARGAVVTDALILPDVWFVPGLKENLVSVSQLAELDHSIGFGRGECCIRSASDAKIIGKGRLQKDGQYVLDYLKVPLPI